MSRRNWVAGNWKMNHTIAQTESFYKELKSKISGLTEGERKSLNDGAVQVALFPSFLSLAAACEYSKGSPIQTGAQNLHWKEAGAFTGEVSGPMACEIGLSLSLVGHSERRQFFGETNGTVKLRAESLIQQGITVMICIGETLEEREAGKTLEILQSQLIPLLESGSEISKSMDGNRVIFAYEPVWAIGTGKTATPEQAQKVHKDLRNLITQKLSAEAAERTPILYGGSVTAENIDSLISQPDIDGALIGGASLKVDSLFSILKTVLHRTE